MIGTVILCPRCEAGHFTPYTTVEPAADEVHNPADDQNLDPDARRMQLTRFPYPALSRVAPIYICSPCGHDEAMRDFAGSGPIPPDEWPILLERDAA